MFDKATMCAFLDIFYGKFETLGEHSASYKKAVEDVKQNPGFQAFTAQQEISFENDLAALIAEASILGYFIGVQDGAHMVKLLFSPELAEKMTKAL